MLGDELSVLFRCDHSFAREKLAEVGAVESGAFEKVIFNVCEDRYDSYRLVFFNGEFVISRGLKKDGKIYRYVRTRVHSSMFEALETFIQQSPYAVTVSSVRYMSGDAMIILHTVKDLGEFVYIGAATLTSFESLREAFDVNDADIVQTDLETLHRSLLNSTRKI